MLTIRGLLQVIRRVLQWQTYHLKPTTPQHQFLCQIKTQLKTRSIMTTWSHKVAHRYLILKVLKIAWLKVIHRNIFRYKVRVGLCQMRAQLNHILEVAAPGWSKSNKQAMKSWKINNQMECRAIQCQGHRIVTVKSSLSFHLKIFNNQRGENQQVELLQRIKFLARPMQVI